MYGESMFVSLACLYNSRAESSRKISGDFSLVYSIYLYIYIKCFINTCIISKYKKKQSSVYMYMWLTKFVLELVFICLIGGSKPMERIPLVVLGRHLVVNGGM